MSDMLICPCCATQLPIGDFLGKEKCYKCIYKDKMEVVKDEVRLRYCKICNAELPTSKWRYCGKACAAIAKKAYKHWTEEIRSQNVVFLKLTTKDSYAAKMRF